MTPSSLRPGFASALSVLAVFAAPLLAQSNPGDTPNGNNSGQPQVLSTGQRITPLAPRDARFEPLNPGLADNPGYTVGQAVSTTVSPDGKTLLILTSGYNLESYPDGPNAGKTNPTDSTEWVFVFDISGAAPIQKQAIPITNSYSGIVFSPDGKSFFVPGGNADNVHIFSQKARAWSLTQTVALGHLALSLIHI